MPRERMLMILSSVVGLFSAAIYKPDKLLLDGDLHHAKFVSAMGLGFKSSLPNHFQDWPS